jgi:cytidine deaminase
MGKMDNNNQNKENDENIEKHEQGANMHNSMNSLILQDKGELVSQTEIVTRSVIRNLIREAVDGMKNAYAPYSHFHVGAALLTVDEHIYKGCNIENASYGLTNCAERTALYKAISEGEREFAAIAIVGGNNGVITDYCPPCGVCRQALREFADPKSFIVILARSEEDYLLYSLEALLPLSFGTESMI